MTSTRTINDVAFHSKIINKGYVEKVSQLSLEADLSKALSIPNGAVYHPNKPEKIRVKPVVFNWSIKFAESALNYQLR